MLWLYLLQNPYNLSDEVTVATGYAQTLFAHEIHLSKTLNAKRNGKAVFNPIEIERIRDALDIASNKEKALVF